MAEAAAGGEGSQVRAIDTDRGQEEYQDEEGSLLGDDEIDE